ncbi:ATP-dependent DNA helicase [Colletotrichum chrysophilum]|uniref:ATP-dependent DNA helicase n=1 Tax=Colletotrichum chrysophilum TaxID=1836956 RepID=A0AAD9A4L2_9PEZI|nr:ATP-dependent DNA helicase [Colletotrichum chrysophilum]
MCRKGAGTADHSRLPLEQIRKESGVPIVKSMQEIKTTATQRHKASDAVRNLKCLLLTGHGSTISFKDAHRNGFVDECAILSWSWQCSIYESSEPSSCYIEDQDGSGRTSRVRGCIMRRVAAYMRYRGVRYVWIDAECIAQDNEEEVEEGMHAMDLLYHFGSHPFGLLARPIETKDHLHLLAKILGGQLAYKSRRNGKFYLRKVANCCAYNIRLDGGVLKNKGYSADLAVLTLFLLNGEIFQYEPKELRDTIPASAITVVDFIKRYAFANFSPPGSKYKLTFNKSCRLVDVRLEADGVHTTGHLWQLDEQLITIPCQPSRRRDTVKTLWLLHGYIQGLGQAPLARRLEEFIARKTSPLAPEENYMWAMADALAAAVHGGSKLRLGYTCNSSKGPPLPMGIFVCSDEAAESPRPAFVFTSFKCRETPIWPAFTSDVDRHVSLQVDVDDNGNLPPKLFARAWMHGLYFPVQRQQPVVFPLPRILNEL